jgi:hypothetical protein
VTEGVRGFALAVYIIVLRNVRSLSLSLQFPWLNTEVELESKVAPAGDGNLNPPDSWSLHCKSEPSRVRHYSTL